jgi:uncharacterized protein
MIIDSHVHISRNSSPDVLLHSMNEAGIDKAIVIAGQVGDFHPNQELLDKLSPYRDRLYAVAAAQPMNKTMVEVEEEIQQLASYYKEKQIVAVKFYTGYHHYYPIEVSSYLRALSEVGCPVIFHSGDCLNTHVGAKLKYAHPLHIDEVAVDFPNINFVIAHMGFPWHRDAAQVCYKNKNVYADVSGFVYGKFNPQDEKKFENVLIEFTQIAGSNQLLFGTDYPISDQKSYIDTMYREFGWQLNIMSKTTQEAFKLL